MKANKPDKEMSTSKSDNVRLNVNQKPPQDEAVVDETRKATTIIPDKELRAKLEEKKK